MVKDRLIAGGLAGATGAIIQNIYGHTAKAIGITDRAFMDFAKVLLTFKPYQGVLAFIVGQISHYLVGVLLGIIFVYIIMLTSSRYLVWKGLGYGAILWVLLLGFGTIFRLPLFMNIPPGPALSVFVGALIYGLVTAYTLSLLEKRTRLL